jgi:hypothetical protein
VLTDVYLVDNSGVRISTDVYLVVSSGVRVSTDVYLVDSCEGWIVTDIYLVVSPGVSMFNLACPQPGPAGTKRFKF